MTIASTGAAFIAFSVSPKLALANHTSRNTLRRLSSKAMGYVASSSASAAAADRMRHLSSSSSLSSVSSNESENLVPSPLFPPKRLLLLRHGQAQHNPRAEHARENGCSFEEFLNLMQQDDAYDADLTSLGENQAKEAGILGKFDKNKRALSDVDMVVSSPLSRAIKTADLVLPPSHSDVYRRDYHTTSLAKAGENALLEKQPPSPRRVCVEHFREINGMLLNAQRRPRTELEDFFPHWNFSHIPSLDTSWTEELESYDDCSERGYRGLLWITEQEEKNILLVSHGGILKYLMNSHERVVLVDGRKKKENGANDEHRCITKRFGNCELREFIMSVWDCNVYLNGVKGADSVDAKILEDKTQPVITLEEVAMSESDGIIDEAEVGGS